MVTFFNVRWPWARCRSAAPLPKTQPGCSARRSNLLDLVRVSGFDSVPLIQALGALTLVFVASCSGKHQSITPAQEIKRLDDGSSKTPVFRVLVRRNASPRTRWMLLSHRLEGPLEGSDGAMTGVDIDSIIASKKKCSDPQCVDALIRRGDGAVPRGIVLRPGAIERTTDPAVRLAGTRPGGRDADLDSITLASRDGDVQRGSGLLSLGTKGEVLVEFAEPIEGGSYVYVALAEDFDLRRASIIFGETPFSTPQDVRTNPDPRVTATRENGHACARLDEYRAMLRRALERAIECLEPTHPEVATALKGIGARDPQLSCYASRQDSICAYGASQRIIVNDAKVEGATDLPCGAPREDLLLFAALDLVRDAPADAYPPADAYRRASQCLVEVSAPNLEITRAVVAARQKWQTTRNLDGVDLDGDGCPNFIPAGWDANCDGAPDAKRRTSDRRVIYDMDGDGNVDFAREVFKDARGWNGYRDIYDRNHDLIVDRIVSTTWSPDRHVFEVVAEDDERQSGSFSKLWKGHYEGKLYQQRDPSRENAWANMSYQGCDAALTKSLVGAWDGMVARGASCLSELSPVLSQAVLNLIVKAKSITISCLPSEGKQAAHVTVDSFTTCNAWADAENCDINIEVNTKMHESARQHLDMVLFQADPILSPRERGDRLDQSEDKVPTFESCGRRERGSASVEKRGEHVAEAEKQAQRKETSVRRRGANRAAVARVGRFGRNVRGAPGAVRAGDGRGAQGTGQRRGH